MDYFFSDVAGGHLLFIALHGIEFSRHRLVGVGGNLSNHPFALEGCIAHRISRQRVQHLGNLGARHRHLALAHSFLGPGLGHNLTHGIAVGHKGVDVKIGSLGGFDHLGCGLHEAVGHAAHGGAVVDVMHPAPEFGVQPHRAIDVLDDLVLGVVSRNLAGPILCCGGILKRKLLVYNAILIVGAKQLFQIGVCLAILWVFAAL